jgi:hypothetical protein
MLLKPANLFQLVHQVHCVAQDVFVCGVQLLRQDLVDSPVFACHCQRPQLPAEALGYGIHQ